MAIFPSRPIDDPQVTSAVVTECPDHGYGVFGWYSEFEARSTSRELDKTCSKGSHQYCPLNINSDGSVEIPIEARDVIDEYLFGAEER